MASDRDRFEYYMAQWESFRNEGFISDTPENGKTAIISSEFTDEEPDTESGISELESFRTEASELANLVSLQGGIPEVAIDATQSDIITLIQDPKVATLYTIGNGSLSTLLLGERDYFDWVSVAKATTHLKLGRFVQRQCGGLTRKINVPLGLFAMADPRDIYAAVGEEFYPTSLEDSENEKIQQVFNTERVSYWDIKDIKLLWLAKNLPQMLPANPETETTLSQFGGNFYKRFLEMKAATEGTATQRQQIYLRMVKERFAIDLVRFYQENQTLCDTICDILNDKKQFDELVSDYDTKKRMQNEGTSTTVTTDDIDEATQNPLGIRSIGMHYWTILNPLLEEAYGVLETRTLNAPFLTK